MALDLSALDAVVAVPASPPLQRAPTAPPSAFVEDPGQPRTEFVEDAMFQALVESVRRQGILQPLIVRRLPSGQLQIRFGARRLRAAIAAELAQIPYLETDDVRQFDDYAQVEENQRRLDLQPLDLAQFIARKLAAGEKKKQVAARLHLDPSAVTHLLALAYEPPALLLELYYSRRCRAPHLLYALRRLMHDHEFAVSQALQDGDVVDRQRVDALVRQFDDARKRATSESASGTKHVASLPGIEGSAGAAELAAVTVEAQVDRGQRAAASEPRTPQPNVSVRVRDLPCIEGRCDGKALELLLDRKPRRDGWAWVRYLEDQNIREVAIGEIVLTRIGSRTSSVGGAVSAEDGQGSLGRERAETLRIAGAVAAADGTTAK